MKQQKFNKACQDGDINTVKQLISDVDINHQDVDEVSPLLIASELGFIEIVEFLLENSAKVNIQKTDGVTALISAAAQDKHEIVELLINHGADISNPCDTTALIRASRNGHLNIVNIIVNRCSTIDLDIKETLSGRTALMVAARFGHIEIMKSLINKGANIDIRDTANGNTALMIAIGVCEYESVACLINCNANTFVKNYLKATAFDKAHEDVISLYYLNPLCNEETLIMKACRLKDEDGVIFLMKQPEGVDFYLEIKGKSAFDILMQHEELPEILQSLKEKMILEKEIDNHEGVTCGL